MNEQQEDPPVTVVISRRVKPGCEEAFEKFISGITAASMTFEGHLGANIFRPSTPGDTEYRIIFKFDRKSNLERWQKSECCRQWLARADSLILGQPVVEVITGLETWFTIPLSKPIVPPPRHKMAVVTLVAIFPLIQIVNMAIAPWFKSFPPLLSSLILTALIVLLMTYVVMPRMTLLFTRWLYPQTKRAKSRVRTKKKHKSKNRFLSLKK
ncbi:hypothetical protein STA3757_28380 [Stanieria sp. NIES-3757]|nr:hypothetical protein STA3757_28380 [Stanieria sp. NIES-3757]